MSNPADAWKSKTQQGDYEKVEYLKLADGETAHVRILDLQPFELYMVRIAVNGKRYPVSVLKEDNERVKAAGHNIQKVNAVNVLDRRDGMVKLWEFSETRKGDIHAIIESWKKMPTEFDLAIARRGKDKNTRYSISIAPNQQPLTDEEKALTKINLSEYYKPSKERLNTLLRGKVPTRKETGESHNSDDEENTVPANTTANPLEDSESVI